MGFTSPGPCEIGAQQTFDLMLSELASLRIAVFSQGAIFVSLGSFSNVRRHFCSSHLGGGHAAGIYWVEARDAATHPAMHRTVPSTKHDPALHERPRLIRTKFRVPVLQSFKQFSGVFASD